MDYLQYKLCITGYRVPVVGFKPCYKWITFNTQKEKREKNVNATVLNLVINGLPSIQKELKLLCWLKVTVLNLVINGLPSILNYGIEMVMKSTMVLNLVINGLPSILLGT